VGEVGDLVLYSPWKFFQIPNGAFVVVPARAARWREAIARSVAELGKSPALGLKWLKDALLRRSARPGAQNPDEYFKDAATVPMGRRPKASPMSAPILSRVSLEDVGRRRRENDRVIHGFFAGRPGWRPIFLESARGPMRSAFRLDTPEAASRAHDALRNSDLHVEAWPGLPPEVRDPDAWAVRLRRTALYLPCHQRLAPDQITTALERSGLLQI
jgi:hypothetical protein